MKTPASTDWYDTPLYYDIVFDADTEREATFLEVMHERRGRGTGRKRRSVLEPACGSGRLVRSLVARGWTAAGFDASSSALAFAEGRLAREGLKADLWQDHMERFQVRSGRRFDLAHCLVSTFKYLQEEEEALFCLRRVAAVLRPGAFRAGGVWGKDSV